MQRLVLSIMVCLMLPATNVRASDESGLAQVTAAVWPVVQVSATTINFGNVIAGNNSVVMASILVTASTGTPYHSIELDSGLNCPGCIGVRKMSGPGGSLLPYYVYQDAAMAQAWGEGLNKKSLAAIGTGHTQQYDVYARLATASDTPPGDYYDTITVQVNY